MRGLKRTCAWRSYELRAGDVHLVDEVLRLAGRVVVADIAATQSADEPLKLSSPQDSVVPVFVLHGPQPATEAADVILNVRGDVVANALLGISGDNDYTTGIKFSHLTPLKVNRLCGAHNNRLTLAGLESVPDVPNPLSF